MKNKSLSTVELMLCFFTLRIYRAETELLFLRAVAKRIKLVNKICPEEYLLSTKPWDENKVIMGELLEFFIKNVVNWAQESSLLSLGILNTVPKHHNHK